MSPTNILRLPIRQFLRPSTALTRPLTRSLPLTTALRPLSTSPLSRYPRKDSQDRESINTEPTEYSKSGTDSSSADQAEAAFDPSTTSPEKEKEIAGQGKGAGNPLEVSPANPEVSKQKGEEMGGVTENAGERKGEDAGRSGQGKTNKQGKV